MKAKRHYRAISVSATMLDGTGGHVNRTSIRNPFSASKRIKTMLIEP
jgi:hypothetical protein